MEPPTTKKDIKYFAVEHTPKQYSKNTSYYAAISQKRLNDHFQQIKSPFQNGEVKIRESTLEEATNSKYFERFKRLGYKLADGVFYLGTIL